MNDPVANGNGDPAEARSRAAPQGNEPVTEPTVASDALFAGARIVRISHAGQTYLLRITRENKLILTK